MKRLLRNFKEMISRREIPWRTGERFSIGQKKKLVHSEPAFFDYTD
jgi:hypothetical protein